MKYGLVGPATPAGGEPGDGPPPDALRSAIGFLLDEAEVDRVLYLGADEIIDDVVHGWAEELVPGGGDEAAFLDWVAGRAPDASPEELDAMLAAEERRRTLERVHSLPDAETCVVEMIEGRILVAVYDKGRLGEEDIANAQLLVYGKATKPLLKRFGPRTFYTPGPLGGGELAVLEALPQGGVELATYALDGRPLERTMLQGKPGAKMVVT